MNIGERIRARRKQLGLTQAQLAEKLYITNKAVSKWETGEANPDLALFPRLAEVLDMSTDELLGVSVEKTVPAEEPKFTTKDRTRYAAWRCLAVLLGLISLLFLGSSLLAFDTAVVSSATEDASTQSFLILFSLFLSLLFFWLLLSVVRKIRRYDGARHRKLRAFCADQGYRLLCDLPKEEQKQLMKDFRKTRQFRLVWIYSGLGIAWLSGLFARAHHPLLGQILYLLSVIGFWLVTALLLTRRQKFLLEKGIYDKR